MWHSIDDVLARIAITREWPIPTVEAQWDWLRHCPQRPLRQHGGRGQRVAGGVAGPLCGWNTWPPQCDGASPMPDWPTAGDVRDHSWRHAGVSSQRLWSGRTHCPGLRHGSGPAAGTLLDGGAGFRTPSRPWSSPARGALPGSDSQTQSPHRAAVRVHPRPATPGTAARAPPTPPGTPAARSVRPDRR